MLRCLGYEGNKVLGKMGEGDLKNFGTQNFRT